MNRIATGINSDFNNDRGDWTEITRQLTQIARAGFTHLQWIHDWDGDYLYSRGEMRKVKRLLKELDLNAHTLHASEGCVRVRAVNGRKVFDHRDRMTLIRKDYTSEDEVMREAGVELIANRIQLCDTIGARAMVLHLQLPFRFFAEVEGGKERYYDAVCRSIGDLAPLLERASVRIAFENLPGTPMAEMEECFDLLFDRFPPELIGLCYDSGHATLQHTHDPLYFLRKYHERVFVTHLQDNDGIPEALAEDDPEIIMYDKHLMPFSGVCDWEGIAKGVAAAQPELPADFEVYIRTCDEAEELALLKECRRRSERFHQMVAACRSEH